MEYYLQRRGKINIALTAVTVLILAVSSLQLGLCQTISSPCTASMISSFTPCLNFVTGSSSNGTSPTSGCCSSLASLISSGTDCLCLIVTGSVPLNIPINRTLAVSLPRACNMGTVPLRCKAAASPLPAPGPFAFSPGLPPRAGPAPTLPDPATEAPAAASPVTPAVESQSPSADSPTASTGIRPVINPSAADGKLPSLVPMFLSVLSMAVLKYY